jgi:hypothetical protein
MSSDFFLTLRALWRLRDWPATLRALVQVPLLTGALPMAGA